MKGLYFPTWFYVLDCLYINTNDVVGITLSSNFDVTMVYKYITEKKQVFTYSYTFQVIKFLRVNEYVKTTKKGRRTLIELTNKGKRLSERVHYIIEELEYKK